MTQNLLHTQQSPIEADFMRLLNDNKARILRICRAYTSSKEDREDLFQEITIQLWKAMPSFRGEAKTSTWLYRIALNVAMRYASTQNRRKSLTERPTWLEEHTQHPMAIDDAARERLERLHGCMKQLPEADRSVLVLYLEDCSYKEISAITGFSVTNVGAKMSRIKDKLLVCMTRSASSISPNTTSSLAREQIQGGIE